MPVLLHATAVHFGGRAVVLKGAAGSGKSTLGWMLIGLGGQLVADDQVEVQRQDDGLWLTAPPALAGKMEARHLGILNTPTSPAWARLVVDMDQTEPERLPPERQTSISDVTLPLIHKVESPAFPAMLRAYLDGGRME